MATILLKRDAFSLDAASISSVLATGLPISILSLAATNPAAASSWIASEVLQASPTGSWYRALPTDIKSYLRAQASVAATAATSPNTTAASSSSSQKTVDAKTYAYSAAAYHMSAGAVAAVVFGTFGFVGICYLLFAWQAHLGPFERWAPRPRHHGEGYERTVSRAALKREFKGSRLDLSLCEDADADAMEMREGVTAAAKEGNGKGVQSGVAEDSDGRPPTGDRESVVTALPRYRPSIFGNAVGWKTGWPSVWMSGK
ncbi:hypothetical protein MPH_12795 [Macrophomina phaseolina MS6]|uniref:Uncharacterized protein n=1 Tax=Macrophomina phaseolina (strain MS6) TaxID=1126212 RepID=K2S0F6_MACPH|nr:hypothetical protein MPH_12795 [Macrophomina phaseolina MS6]